jgi:hypothetical protein
MPKTKEAKNAGKTAAAKTSKPATDTYKTRRTLKENNVWNKFFTSLQAYKAQYNHCNVPIGFAANPPLGLWVRRQRVVYKAGTLNVERKAKLNSLGFAWQLHDVSADPTWDESYQLLVAYKSENGNCNVPLGYAENPSLANWVHNQRTFIRTGTIKPGRHAQLRNIGFQSKLCIPAKPVPWSQNLTKVKAFERFMDIAKFREVGWRIHPYLTGLSDRETH